jgi:hypothetical protein
MLTIPTFCCIGIPLLLYGGLNIPYSLTPEESRAAGANQGQALAEKRIHSVEYTQMLIGVGFFAASVGLTTLCMLTLWLCPHVVVEPEPVAEAQTVEQSV